MTSLFDPQLFLDAQVTEPNERRAPLPVENPAAADGLYLATIGEVTMTSGEKSGKDGVTRTWLSAVVPLLIDVPQVLQDSLKLPAQLQLTDRAFIDLTPNNTIDNAPGRNRRQKLYREAADQNKAGDTFSWRKLQGRVVKLKIDHEIYENNTQERISNILKG